MSTWIRSKTLLFSSLIAMGVMLYGFQISLQTVPGYMDAEYYFTCGLMIVKGLWKEPFVWNFLNATGSIPEEMFLYWMPLNALLAAIGMKLSGWYDFSGGRLLFVVFAICISPFSAWFSLRKFSNIRYAWFSGILALFPAFYFPYFSTTDSFSFLMICGAGIMLLVDDVSGSQKPSMKRGIKTFGLGIIVGCVHLMRSEGLVWLFILLLFLSIKNIRAGSFKDLFVLLTSILLGYLLVTSVWYSRNIVLMGSLFPSGGGRALWLTTYDELFTFPPDLLTFERFFNSGSQAIFKARLDASAANLQTALAVQNSIILLPFVLISLWKFKKQDSIQLTFILWLALLFVMSIIFPFAGENGGYFHSAAGLQILLWVIVPPGLDIFTHWFCKIRKWEKIREVSFFFSGLVLVICVLLTVYSYVQRVWSPGQREGAWGRSAQHYQDVDMVIRQAGANQDEIILVNNPPSYYAATQRMAVVIPYGDENVLYDVAHRYGAVWVALENRNPWQLAPLYKNPEQSAHFDLMATVETTLIFRIRPE